jgi:hypothetical protein
MSERSSNQLATRSFNDLRRAIESVPTHPGALVPGQNAEKWLRDWNTYHQSCHDAWRTAFEWFHTHMGRPDEGPEKDAEYFAEYEEGMRMIKERLR